MWPTPSSVCRVKWVFVTEVTVVGAPVPLL
jgi:hypothetical protein